MMMMLVDCDAFVSGNGFCLWSCFPNLMMMLADPDAFICQSMVLASLMF
jgi:hypothetical protein